MEMAKGAAAAAVSRGGASLCRGGHVDGVGKDPWAAPAEELQMDLGAIDAWFYDRNSKGCPGCLAEQGAVSDQTDMRLVGDSDRELCGARQGECIAHRGASPLLRQDEGESGCRPEIVERDIHPAVFQGSQEQGDVSPVVSGEGAFGQNVSPDEAENPGEGEHGNIDPQ